MNYEDLLWVALSAPLALGLVSLVHSNRRRRPMPVFRIPPAEETARAIKRFQAAAEKFRLLEEALERREPPQGPPSRN